MLPPLFLGHRSLLLLYSFLPSQPRHPVSHKLYFHGSFVWEALHAGSESKATCLLSLCVIMRFRLFNLLPHVLKLVLTFTPTHLPLYPLLRAHKLIWPSRSLQGPQLGKRSRKIILKTSGYLWHNAKVSCKGRLTGARRTWPLITVPGEIKGGFRE